nr:hypothetical protein [Fodinicola feengrottensis]
MSTADTIWWTRSNICDRDTAVAPSGTRKSALPSAAAIPALVVAMAAKPASANRIALPASQALGIKKHSSCSSRKVLVMNPP